MFGQVSVAVGILLLLGAPTLPAQTLPVDAWEKLDSLAAQQQRYTLVFLHTNWCRYCRSMEKKVFTQPSLQALLHEKIFFLPFDAEYPEAVVFAGKTWQFLPRGGGKGRHELALALTTALPSPGYPVLLLLNPALEIVWQHQGFLPAPALEKVLQQALKKP